MNASRSMAKPPAASGPTRLVFASLALCAALMLVYWGIGLGETDLDGALETEKNPASLIAPSANAFGPGLPADAAERQKKAALLEALANASQRYTEFSNATSQSIIDLHLETAFTPESLSSAPTLSESFQKIGRLQELQQFAAKTKADYFAGVQATIKGSGLSAPAIDQQMADFERSQQATGKLEKEIQSLESQTTKAAIAILEFARAELGKSTLVGGQLVFQNPEKDQQLQRLMAQLIKSSGDQNKASVRISELQQKQKYAMDRILAK